MASELLVKEVQPINKCTTLVRILLNSSLRILKPWIDLAIDK